MAKPRTMVYVIGLKHHVGKLLPDVVVFIRGFAENQAAKLIRLVGSEFFHDQRIASSQDDCTKILSYIISCLVSRPSL